MPSDRNVAADYYADRLGWSQETRIGWHNIGPGKPKHNVFIKRFNDGLRDEPLNQTLFTFFAHAREVLAVWKDGTVRSGRTAPSATSGLPLTPTSAI
jgi:putative transposase